VYPQGVRKNATDWVVGGGAVDMVFSLEGTPYDPSGGSTGGATSTVEQAQTNLAFAFAFFFVSFFGVIWLLRKH